MKVLISDLWVLQNGLRNVQQVERMIEFVGEGGKFTYDARLAQHLLTEQGRPTPPPMHISIMEDGRLMLHDGHHRAVAMFLAGRKLIHESEYECGTYTYDDYNRAHPERGWFSPFDVRAEVRRPDFAWFKSNAKRVYEQHGAAPLEEFILTHRDAYVEKRRVNTVAELSQVYIKHNLNKVKLCQTHVNCAAAS